MTQSRKAPTRSAFALAIDVGNTLTRFGLFEGNELVRNDAPCHHCRRGPCHAARVLPHPRVLQRSTRDFD